MTCSLSTASWIGFRTFVSQVSVAQATDFRERAEGWGMGGGGRLGGEVTYERIVGWKAIKLFVTNTIRTVTDAWRHNADGVAH
jgi:hypothetical protein